MRRKIVALITVFAVAFSFLVPTLALADAPRRPSRPPIRRHVVKRPAPRFNPRIGAEVRRAQIRQKRAIRYEKIRSRHIIRHRVPVGYFRYHGHPYIHGYYRGYYSHHWRVMHSSDWIALLGLAAFTSYIDNSTFWHDDTVVLNSDGRVVEIVDATLGDDVVIIDKDGNVIPIKR